MTSLIFRNVTDRYPEAAPASTIDCDMFQIEFFFDLTWREMPHMYIMKLRDGGVDYGRLYEQKIAALFSIRCALDTAISDFWMLSNINDFGAFDDIVLSVKYGDGSKKLFCIQLKHQENKSLLAKSLEYGEGNFSLPKYLDSYQRINKNFKKIDALKGVSMDQVYYILYTNSPLAREDQLTSIKLEKSEGLDLLKTSSSTSVSVFQIGNLESADSPLDENFLKKFFLYSRQASATFLDKLIKNEFDSHFEDISNTVIITVADYFVKWALGKKGKIKKIFKKDVQMKLLELLLSPHVVEPKPAVAKNIAFDLLNDTLTNFNVTPVAENTSLGNIFASISHVLQETCEMDLNLYGTWHTNLTYEQIDALKVKGKPKKQLINDALTEKSHLYFSAWQCKIVPLVINCDLSLNSIQEILLKFENVTKDLSFVLFSLHDINRLKQSLKVFNNFNDISDNTLINRNLENTFISLQGKGAIPLKEFKNEAQVLGEITPDIYNILLNGVLQIGESSEVESYYIKRYFQRPCLRFNVLHENNVLKERESDRSGDIFFVVEYIKNDFMLYEYKKNSVDFITYLKNCINDNFDDKKYIVNTPLPVTDQRLLTIIEQIHETKKKAVHVVKRQGNVLQWLYSKGSIEILRDFLLDSSQLEGDSQRFIPEDDVLKNYKSEINIISNNAGMGKTFMLRSLSNKFTANKWVCFINLNEHMLKISKLNQEPLDYIQYVMDSQIDTNDKIVQKLCKQIYRNRWNSKNVVWLLDGYDEVASDDTLEFLRQVKTMRNVKTWITTRPTYQKELEIEMDTLSSEITYFSKDDHVAFLWKYFETYQDPYSQEQIQYIINTIKKCATALDETFISIPLQTRMFAQIFGDDINHITEKETLTIVDLYNKFVDIKLKDYKSYEVTSLKKTLSKLALKLFFAEDQLDELLDFEELTEEAVTFQESYKKDSLVIGLNENGDAVFGHRTFAEFLAAQWLTKQIITRKGNCNLDWKPLVEKLFYVEMIPVRIFFDRILSQNLPLHLAVLNNDVEGVQRLLNEKTVARTWDILGRSALHLAVSYGKYYDLYVSSGINGLKNVGLHATITESKTGCKVNIPSVTTQLVVRIEITEMLLKWGVSNTTDFLFHYDAFDFAMKSCSLDAVNCLYTTFEKDDLYFEPNFNFKVFLYCIIYDNLHNIFSERKIYNFDVTTTPQWYEPMRHKLRDAFKHYNFNLLKLKYNDQYLTEIAALTGGKETLFELLQTGQLTVKDGFPVHRACYNGHSDIVNLLHGMGADVAKVDKDGWDPIFQAARRGRSDITYKFLKEGIGNKSTSMTPMHYACQGGHLECVKILTRYGVSATKTDGYGYTPLWYASLYGHVDVVAFSLVNLSATEVQAKNVQSLLNVVAAKGYSVQKLLDCGLLDVNNFDEDGNTPLILASKNGFPKIIRELSLGGCDLHLMKTESLSSLVNWAQLNNHIDFSIKCCKFHIGLRTCGGMTALHLAAMEGHVICVNELIECGANKDLENTLPVLNYSPLIWASITGQEAVVEALLTLKSDQKYSQSELEDAEIALLWASILGYVECLKVLLERVPNLEHLESSRNKDRIEQILMCEYGTSYNPVTRPFGAVKNLPLVLAAINDRASVIQGPEKGFPDSVRILVEAGADVNAKNERFLRLLPIAWASMYGRTDVVKYFLSIRTEEFANDRDVHLAVNWAALGDHLDCLKMLLDAGLDVDNTDDQMADSTPLISACEHGGTTRVIDELLARKCKVAVKNTDGLSALDFASRKRDFEVVKRLINSGAYQDWTIDRSCDLYKHLQAALEWAKVKGEDSMLYNLVELGISECGSGNGS
ncbi:hypothetical protein NQ318_019000 [Aromia moschata]|uniref:NACHT domain-containing protein n=1 Tax=Aromia moschata TaxID=1265417 RepID=A0AAV8YDN6_9CUCU|nr:hypothetical protein NQ318_019000 [Aromia moschata]